MNAVAWNNTTLALHKAVVSWMLVKSAIFAASLQIGDSSDRRNVLGAMPG